MNKNHGNCGNKNAAKEKTADGMISFRLPMEQKNQFVKAAQSRGQKLKDFLIEAALAASE